MNNLIKTAAVTGMLSGLMLSAGCEETNIYTVGGSISGLDATGALANNDGSLMNVNANGSFSFSTLYSDNTDYNVTVHNEPAWQSCVVSNASGTIAAANITDIVVTCTDNDPYEPNPKPKSKPLNDTGYTLCANVGNKGLLDCSATGASISAVGIDGEGKEVPAGQDAFYGRDATHNDNSDGHAGFSYTKLGSSGQALPASATSWDCVQDNITGLTWEVKTNDRGLRDKDWTYTWYNSSNSNDGGDHGLGDTGWRTTTHLEFPSPTISIDGYDFGKAGSDNCDTNSRCDTEKYVADVNAAGLCGTGSDWRMPTLAELRSLTNTYRASPAIVSDYFPNTFRLGAYHSATPAAYRRSLTWIIDFSNAQETPVSKRGTYYVRLVRASQ